MIFKHIAPELLVYFAFRRFDELFQKGLQFGNPPFQPVFFQPSGLTQYFLPIFRRSFERYFGNSANDTQHDKLEIRFRGLHQGHFGSHLFQRCRRRKITGQQPDQFIPAILSDLFGKFGKSFLPCEIGIIRSLVCLHNQRLFPGKIGKIMPHGLRVGFHMPCKPLANQQPDHVRGQNERSMIRISLIHPVKKRIVLEGNQTIRNLALGYDTKRII